MKINKIFFCKFDNVSKWLTINFKEKVHLKDPTIFASFGGLTSIKVFTLKSGI